ncbi:phytosulfokines-like [Punica granatum]|uniref:Phytosulfokine n=2 Tax=Punica granatum TaxID=22663 RepID=A0A218VWJ4_PUNGR|nr:phytosulfokines-like [Punica granatum]OWM64776.1 hypothetical protein CDL15_Pgr028493 [Punica granatum]PKI71618.1 hypothetical protein CRG98_007941 [Punica granatum]
MEKVFPPASFRSRTALLLTLLVLFLLLNSSCAARPNPVLPFSSTAESHSGVTEAEESCEGRGEEECLMRRTLAAHIDYIYTQKHKN